MSNYYTEQKFRLGTRHMMWGAHPSEQIHYWQYPESLRNFRGTCMFSQ